MDELAIEAQQKMGKSIEALGNSYRTLRTGRASATLLDKVEADYYGDKLPINQIASISVPEPRQLLVKPYSGEDLKTVVAAINASDLGLNPIVDGNQIRIVIPALTEDRRRELVKKAKAYSEDTKISIRNIRRDYFDFLKDDDSYSDDLKKRIEQDIQKVTDEANRKVEETFAEKEKEIMTI